MKFMKIKSLALLLAVSLLSQPAMAKLYKWVDENGNIHYTDKMPPKAAQQGHTRLNEQGMEVETISGAKSAEEIAREQELKRLREEQQQLLKEQEAKDAAMLKTFRTEDDITLARNGKLASIDAQVKVLMKKIEALKEQLSRLQADAAALELEGRKPEEKQLSRIGDTRTQIEASYATLVHREREKNQVNAQFEKDVARFRVLKNLKAPQTVVNSAPPEPNILLETVVPCPDVASCDKIWQKARAYGRTHATTRPQVDGNRILLFAPPRKDQDISLAVSRIRDYAPGKEAIFLDIQCKGTPLGREFCEGEQIHKIRYGFREAVTDDTAPSR